MDRPAWQAYRVKLVELVLRIGAHATFLQNIDSANLQASSQVSSASQRTEVTCTQSAVSFSASGSRRERARICQLYVRSQVQLALYDTYHTIEGCDVILLVRVHRFSILLTAQAHNGNNSNSTGAREFQTSAVETHASH